MTKWTEKTAKAALKLAGQANNWLYEERTKELSKTLPALIGKAYRFRNSYGGDDGWWLYSLVVGVDGRNINIIQVQTTSHGKVEIEEDSWYDSPLGGNTEVSRSVFDKAFQDAVAKLTKATQTPAERAGDNRPARRMT